MRLTTSYGRNHNVTGTGELGLGTGPKAGVTYLLRHPAASGGTKCAVLYDTNDGAAIADEGHDFDGSSHDYDDAAIAMVSGTSDYILASYESQYPMTAARFWAAVAIFHPGIDPPGQHDFHVTPK